MTKRRLFGTNGIRGMVNQDLTPEFVMKVAKAVGTFFEGGQILVGYDGRTSSSMFTRAVISGLISTGCTVNDAGLAPTPAIQYAVKHHNMKGAIIITASHKPPEYNGIKVVGYDGIELPREKEIKIEKIFFDEQFNRVDGDEIKEIHKLPGILDVYIEAVKQHVDIDAIQKKRFHTVVDPGNGVGGLTTPYLLRELGCRVTTMNANIDGTFPSRPPEPKPENLHGLASAVKAVNADMGVALDGDGDRAIFVDEKGKIHWGDRSFALIEKYFLKDNPGEIIVTPVSSSYLIEDIANKYGGKVVWTKVGSIIVAHKMKKMNTKLGGEENGGILYAPHQLVRDAAMATALILDIMAKTEKKLSELLAELPLYHVVKDKIDCPNKLKERVFEDFIKKIKDVPIYAIDGAKIKFPDKSSILIRASGTEPFYRFYAEGKTRKRAVQLIKEYKEKICKIVDKLQGD